jgi:signal peptidase I
MTNDVHKGRRIAGVVVGLILILGFVYFKGVKDVSFFLVPTKSMIPTLYPRDYIVTMSDGQYERGDIVVLDDPGERGAFVVKRVVGLPGDSLSIKTGALYINDRYASEPYIREPMLASTDRPIRVPADTVFVLGDNRNESEDSLKWGPVPMDSIIGRVRYIYNPTERMGPVESYPLDAMPALPEY